MAGVCVVGRCSASLTRWRSRDAHPAVRWTIGGLQAVVVFVAVSSLRIELGALLEHRGVFRPAGVCVPGAHGPSRSSTGCTHRWRSQSSSPTLSSTATLARLGARLDRPHEPRSATPAGSCGWGIVAICVVAASRRPGDLRLGRGGSRRPQVRLRGHPRRSCGPGRPRLRRSQQASVCRSPAAAQP